MIRRVAYSALTVAALSFACLSADAYEVSPMSYDLASLGPGASKVLRVNNTEDRPITVEMLVFKRTITEDGTEKRVAADDAFVIFPVQTIIQPGKAQAIRIQYVGESDIPHAQSYVIQVTQVPVKVPDDQSRVQFVVNFGTAAYVLPPNAKAQLGVAGVEPGTKQGTVRAVLENTGMKYARLSDTSWTVKNAAGKEYTLVGEPLRGSLNFPIVPAKGRRVFDIPAPADFDTKGPLTLTISGQTG